MYDLTRLLKPWINIKEKMLILKRHSVGLSSFFEYKPENIIELEITHKCNKMCSYCSHRIENSPYTYLEMGRLNYIIECIRPYTSIKEIRLVGGEPLVHPHFKEICLKLMRELGVVVIVDSNSRLIPKIDESLFNRLKWRISEYPDWNDNEVKMYRDKQNVKIIKWRGFKDPDIDPDLDEKTAKRVEKMCYHQVRVVDNKVYRCCHSESIERTFNVGKVHTEMSKNWLNDWYSLPVWKACIHCFFALNVLGSEQRTVGHDKMISPLL